MQWLTMSWPTPRGRPSARGQLDLGADAVGGGHEHRVVHAASDVERAAERADAREHRRRVGALDAGLQRRRRGCPRRCRRRRRRTMVSAAPGPASRCRGAPACRRTRRRQRPYAAGAGRGEVVALPVTASTRPPVACAVGEPGGEQSRPSAVAARGRDDGRGRSAVRVAGGGATTAHVDAGAHWRAGAGRRAPPGCRRGRPRRGRRRAAAAPPAPRGRRSGSSTREPGAVGGEHQTGVEHADVWRALGGEVVDDRLHERAP